MSRRTAAARCCASLLSQPARRSADEIAVGGVGLWNSKVASGAGHQVPGQSAAEPAATQRKNKTAQAAACRGLPESQASAKPGTTPADRRTSGCPSPGCACPLPAGCCSACCAVPAAAAAAEPAAAELASCSAVPAVPAERGWSRGTTVGMPESRTTSSVMITAEHKLQQQHRCASIIAWRLKIFGGRGRPAGMFTQRGRSLRPTQDKATERAAGGNSPRRVFCCSMRTAGETPAASPSPAESPAQNGRSSRKLWAPCYVVSATNGNGSVLCTARSGSLWNTKTRSGAWVHSATAGHTPPPPAAMHPPAMLCCSCRRYRSVPARNWSTATRTKPCHVVRWEGQASQHRQ